ncbi:monoacylglycerol/Diacylglycerol O-acyltransferase isoform X1 [Zootoca vivipara]|uniref:monoacylglycerol/Diacylglycerol O-acyltransferase isoform X1 n=2 Tax=Zootoca vivipara TaxID=8524 RepID=UPI00293BA29E|nr:monoacylglycerol/Diacylglycerol O-acyltransferase isoform X1 [Zootoca vivipara]
MSYSTCLTYLMEEWIFLEYLPYVIICSVVLVFINILLLFTIPVCVLLFLYLSSLFLFIYERTHKLKEAYSSKAWDGARLIIAFMWDRLGRFLNGYELRGIENLPDGPGLIIFYHGTIPIDYAYFLAKLILLKRRSCYTVADRCVFKFPGFKRLGAVMWLLPGTQQECVNVLKNGHLLGIAPGGVREALFSDKSYKLVWKNRKGFAQVAIDAKVPIIPMHTQNVREGFRVFGRTRFTKWCFESLRLPVLPPYGGFPVKFRTYIGKPIPYDPNITATELATKSKAALQALIQMHQQIPGNIYDALMERFHKEKGKKT